MRVHSISCAGPEGPAPILAVAKDITDCWLVQDGLGQLSRRFASLEAALSFTAPIRWRGHCHLLRAYAARSER
jgi:hypothetical protein